ncbi:MAG: hypothetical protein Q7R93_05725 [bacterium]|nr:hypothetical protein [bacterium]
MPKQIDPNQATNITTLLKLYEGADEELRIATRDGKEHSGRIKSVNNGNVFLQDFPETVFRFISGTEIVSVSGIHLK